MTEPSASLTEQNQRLFWELQTLSDIAAGVGASLELDEILSDTLERLARAMNAAAGAIRLRSDVTGLYQVSAVCGPEALRGLLLGEWTGVPRPSDQVIATGATVIVDDLAALTGPAPAGALRSAVSVPMTAGGELLGTVSLGSTEPERFGAADAQLLSAIAAQLAVAIQNARLHRSVLRAKREWEQTVDAIGDPMAVYDGSGTLLRGNRALAEHLGLEVTSLPGTRCRDVGFCGGDPTCDGCAVTRSIGQARVQSEVTTADGRIFSVMTFRVGAPSQGPSVVQIAKNVTEEVRNARRLREMSNELAAANAQLRDALEQLKATQAQLVQAEKLSAIGCLVGGVAHELNNPLTSVIGYAQLLEDEMASGPSLRPPAEVAQDLRRIAEESDRAAGIIRNLLAFAGRQPAERVPQNISEIWSRVLSLRAYELRTSGITLETAVPLSLPPVVADRGQLQQVFLNLILNAERAMRGCAERRLTIAGGYDAELQAVTIAVTDTGRGIDAADLPRVFDPFFTTHDVGEGAGLGLSICYGVVRDHGGEITVESRSGEGTTVRVLLPVREAAGGGAAVPVLVGHRNQAERDFLTAALAGWGYSPRTAGASHDVLAALTAQPFEFAIVEGGLLDDDVRAWWRDLQQALPRLIAASHERSQVEGIEAGAVLGVPLTLRALRAALRTAVKECV